MKLNLPKLPGLNEYIEKERTNKFLAAKLKREATEMVAWTAKAAPGLRKVELVNWIDFIWKCKDRKKDPDNIAFAAKFVMDGLVMAGIFPTDGWKLWIGSHPEIHHKFRNCRKNEEEGVVVVWH